MEPRCGFCYQRSKTAEHVLWTCPFARNVWELCRGKIQKCSNAATDFFSLFRLMVDRLSSNELEKWATKSWALWTARNKFYLEKIQWHPKRILGEALGYLLELGMATGRVRARFFHTRTRPAGQDPWPEPDPFIKRIFFLGPELAPTGPTGPVGLILMTSTAQPKIKNKIFFLRENRNKNFDLGFFSPKSQTQT